MRRNPVFTPVAVTGMGALTPFGSGVQRLWNAIMGRRTAVGPPSDARIAHFSPAVAEVKDFSPMDHLPKKTVRDTDRSTQLALVAAAEAMADAGWTTEEDPFELRGVNANRTGIAWGTAFGGLPSYEEEAVRLAKQPEGRVGPRVVSKAIPNAAEAALAMHYGIRGPAMTYATACAASANALGEALQWLWLGIVDQVVTGGSESLFTPTALGGLRSAGAVAMEGEGDLSTWCKPFDVDRTGMVMGEGAAALILEPLDRARARGAKVYAVLVGYGASNDAYHETAPHPDGTGAVLAMERALYSAGLGPADIDYINAHATATPAGDRAESLALRRVFGGHLNQIPVSSTKGGMGHLLGAAGAVESIISIKSIETGWIPPTLHCRQPDPEAPPDLVLDGPRRQHIAVAMSNSFGFGGQNGVLIWADPGLFSR
ncbi:beta-ketoacyl-[acyl-carrier-protein] synthase family protein [Kyrpidia tusciae]|uniref:Beta-ketoacyl synthase n=1 Tax=Kyrpidia tusciae (strain DSM 2912 / NBRC 15312 / T2) TaxID=562970 RepID=D5WWU0_KYRT2|nr:beta-ketoacyl-[acyl-carrier-protein] synthase family protein [Kyrpidia tusciae]ADG05791.1 Beta-ketoacyl synthase [Kyrpidia tusciae DSM 2912]